MSGRLNLDITAQDGNLTLSSLEMTFRAGITARKPVSKDCPDCKERYEELKKWTFLTEPRKYKKGEDNQFPFSYLLPGHLPASTQVHLGSIYYYLLAVATTRTGESIEVKYPIKVQRAIPPALDKTSIRIFPPTNLTGRVVMPPHIHPIGTFEINMTVNGIVEKKKDSQTRWRLRKMMWRIEENIKTVSKPCAKHAIKLGEGKAVEHVRQEIVGSDEMKHGWKSDFDTPGGEINLKFECGLSQKPEHKAMCDVESEIGMSVKHNLVVELIVAEEFCPNSNTNLITPTGAARVLRMQFVLVVTERGGMGVAWDEEMPPVYEDVPESPPGYGRADGNSQADFGGAIMEDYTGPALEHYDLERVQTTNADDPPVYRQRDPHEYATLPVRSPHFVAQNSLHEFMRPPSQGSPLVNGESSHARDRAPRWNIDDFSLEPPEYRTGRREREASNGTIEEDVQVGESGTAPQTSNHAENSTRGRYVS